MSNKIKIEKNDDGQLSLIVDDSQSEFTSAEVAEFYQVDESGLERKVYTLSEVLSLSNIIDTNVANDLNEWKNQVVLDYLDDGVAINKSKVDQISNAKFEELEQIINLFKQNVNHDVFEGKEVDLFTLIEDYAHTWDTFHYYDLNELEPAELHAIEEYKINLEDALHVKNNLRQDLVTREVAKDVFGQENPGKFEAVIGSINQQFDGKDLYKSVEEKAAHILYLVVKDHPFVDGNKRIGAALFVYYLQKNNFAWKASKEAKINDNALVALTLLVATSDPADKNTMINLIIRLVQNDYEK